jgi:hypothetical protein
VPYGFFGESKCGLAASEAASFASSCKLCELTANKPTNLDLSLFFLFLCCAHHVEDQSQLRTLSEAKYCETCSISSSFSLTCFLNCSNRLISVGFLFCVSVSRFVQSQLVVNDLISDFSLARQSSVAAEVSCADDELFQPLLYFLHITKLHQFREAALKRWNSSSVFVCERKRSPA